MSSVFPGWVAILADPKSKRRGVGPEAVERLLGAWLGNPVVLGHREDGSPLITGAQGHHISLGHATGITAVALADRPVGVDIATIALTPADRRVAASLFTKPERTWLDELPEALHAAGFAQLWALKEAILKRDRQGLDRHDLPELSAILAGLEVAASAPGIPWRPWAALDSSPGSAAGLQLSMPATALARVGLEQLAVAQLPTPTVTVALALAWTAPTA